MTAAQKYPAAVESLVESGNMGVVIWKIALAATVNPADLSFVPGLTDLASGGGYTQGGNICTTTSATQVGGLYRLILANPAQWVGTGSGFGPLRYAILWDSSNNIPYLYWDYGSSITVADTQTFNANLSSTNGAITVQ